MSERESSRSYHSASRFRTRRTRTSGVVMGRARVSLFFGAYFAVLCAVMWVGERPLPIKPGKAAPYDVRARVSYSYPDEALREAARETAREQEPGTYILKPNWPDDVLSSIARIFAVVRTAKTEKDALDALRAGGIEIDIAPFWRLRAEKGLEAFGTILERLRSLLRTLGDNGVLDDFVYSEERRAGHSFIRLKSGEEVRTVSLARDMAFSEVRRLLIQRLEAALNDYPEDVRGLIKHRLWIDVTPSLEYSERDTLRNREAAAAAVAGVENIDVDGYVAIANAASADEALNRRIVARIAELREQ